MDWTCAEDRQWQMIPKGSSQKQKGRKEPTWQLFFRVFKHDLTVMTPQKSQYKCVTLSQYVGWGNHCAVLHN